MLFVIPVLVDELLDLVRVQQIDRDIANKLLKLSQHPPDEADILFAYSLPHNEQDKIL